MSRKQISHLSLLMAVLLGTVTLYSQAISPALKAYNTWKEKSVNAEIASEGNFAAMAFAVTKQSESQARVCIVIGVGQNVEGLGKVSFVVQPMITKQVGGKNQFEAIGDPGTLNFPEIEYDKASKSGIIADSQITIKVPSGATVVKVSVINSILGSSVMLPLTDEISTAVISGKSE